MKLRKEKTITFSIFYIDIIAIDYYELAVVVVMTFKDLKKFVEKNNDGSSSSSINNNNNNYKSKEEIKLQFERFAIFSDKPFWIENIEKHKAEDIKTKGNCCFNHILGLPKKDGIEHKIYDYEQTLVSALDNHKSVFVKKARGLGITEIILRYISWLCTRNYDFKGKRIHIVTSPRINLAEDLLDSLRLAFEFIDNR